MSDLKYIIFRARFEATNTPKILTNQNTINLDDIHVKIMAGYRNNFE